jgi:hypothetical protein
LVDCEELRVCAPFDPLLSVVGDLCPAWFAGVDFLAILDMALSVKSNLYYMSFVSRLDEVCDRQSKQRRLSWIRKSSKIKSPAPGDGNVVRKSIRPNGCKFDQQSPVECRDVAMH